MIAFVDAGPGTRFLPQAAELNDGRVVTFFGPLVEKLKRDGGTLPGTRRAPATDAGKLQRDVYWNWFADHWNADKAVRSSRMSSAMAAALAGSTTARHSIAARRYTCTSLPAATTTPACSPTTSSVAAAVRTAGSLAAQVASPP